MLGGAKEAMAKRMAEQITPSETPIGQAAATTIATLEAQQATAINRLAEAADRPDLALEADPEQRRALLLDLADAIADGRRKEWWFQNVAPELMNKPDRAMQYVGLGPEEYREQLEDWYRGYYDAGVVDEPLEEADRAQIGEFAEYHVQTVFNVSLREFVATVVNWDAGRAFQRVLAGPIGRHTQTIHAIADDLEETTDD